MRHEVFDEESSARRTEQVVVLTHDPTHGCRGGISASLAAEHLRVALRNELQKTSARTAVLSVEQLVTAAVAELEHLFDSRTHVLGDAGPIERLLWKRQDI